VQTVTITVGKKQSYALLTLKPFGCEKLHAF